MNYWWENKVTLSGSLCLLNGRDSPLLLAPACRRTAYTYINTPTQPHTGFTAWTPQPIHHVSPEKRATFREGCKRAEGAERVWGTPELVQRNRQNHRLSLWDVTSHPMVSAAHETVAWNKEEFEWAAQGDTDNINHPGLSQGTEPG